MLRLETPESQPGSRAESRIPVLLSGGGIGQDRIGGRPGRRELEGQVIDENWIAGTGVTVEEGGSYIGVRPEGLQGGKSLREVSSTY